MFFQFSPPKISKPPPTPANMDRPEILSLAPFTANPKIYFENIKVGTTLVKQLIIRNPLSSSVQLHVSKYPPPERRVVFSWTEQTIDAASSITLSIEWSPLKDGAWCDTISLTDGKRIKRDIMLILKSIATKEPKNLKQKKKISVSSSKLKSPIGLKKPQLQRHISPNKISKTYTKVVHSTALRRETFNVPKCNNKENLCLITQTSSHPSTQTNIDENIRRDTYILNKLPLIRVEHFNDSLEINENNLRLPLKSKEDNFLHHINSEKLWSNPEEITPEKNTPPRKVKNNPEKITPEKFFQPTRFSTGKKSLENGLPKHREGNSFESYVKGNLSSETYTKDSDIANLTDLTNANFLVSEPPTNAASVLTIANSDKRLNALDYIEEENIDNNVTTLYRNFKRKSVNKYKITPPKKAKTLAKDDIYINDLHKSKNIHTDTNKTIFKAYMENHQNNKIAKLHNPNAYLRNLNDPFILSATNIDPFMSAALYFDQQWMQEQIEAFKRWLNALLTPPAEFGALTSAHEDINVAKLWQECQKGVVVKKAPTREAVSIQYHVSGRLDSLRKNAVTIFRRPEIAQVLSKVSMLVENNRLTVRTDRNVHADLSLQYEIMHLFLSYNPLWLRIGLETIFGEYINLHSNSDVTGLTTFIMNHYFKDRGLLKKHKTTLNDKYIAEIKKHMLRNFLCFIYFVDKAKLAKLVPHDPCLFRRKSEFKESRDVLIHFSKEVLASIGDVTKCLKTVGYVVSYKQSHIDEYSYAVENLGVDLRDGVRLTRVMELILLEDNLTSELRLPAISRLQKIHNVKLAFQALERSGFQIQQNIEPKDIVDGHKEKTLSFLWQIIYKFEAPRFTKAIFTIQYWWRTLHIVIERRIIQRKRIAFAKKQNNAASIIQKFCRRFIVRQKYERFIIAFKIYLEFLKMNRAVIKIQSMYRMYAQRRNYLKIRESALIIQRNARRFILSRIAKEKNKAAVKIQACVKCYLARQRYLKLKQSVIIIEEKYMAFRMLVAARDNFQALKSSSIIIQRCFRANQEMHIARTHFMTIKMATVTIQRKFKAYQLMLQNRQRFLDIKSAAVCLQNQYRALRCMRDEKTKFEKLKQATIIIQQHYRAQQLMRTQSCYYSLLKVVTINIQQRFKANAAAKRQRLLYLQLKSVTIFIQQRVRAKKAMLTCREDYLKLKQTVLNVQSRFRANKLAMRENIKYSKLKAVTIIVQRRFKANLAMKREKAAYDKLRNDCIVIQRRFRAKRLMLSAKKRFEELKLTALNIQRRFRANKLAHIEASNYRKFKVCTINIQRRFRALIEMRKQRKAYQDLYKACVVVQWRYRAKCLMLKEKTYFNQLKLAALFIQRLFRAKLAMVECKNNYTDLRNASILIQCRFRAKLAMKHQRLQYIKDRNSVIFVQRRFRALKAMKEQRTVFETLRKAAIIIQQRMRANKLMTKQRTEYIQFKKAVINVQIRFRATREMKIHRDLYLQLHKSVIFVQTLYRSKLEMRKQFNSFVELKTNTLKVQKRFRGLLQMRITRANFLALRNASIFIQRRFRANKLMAQCRMNYLKQRHAAITIQRRYRALKAMHFFRLSYLNLRASVIKIQKRFRGKLQMCDAVASYNKVKLAVVCVQQRFKAYFLMKQCRQKFLESREVCIKIQRRFRALKIMQQQYKSYMNIRKSTLIVQRRFRGKKLMELSRINYLRQRYLIIYVQQRFKTKIQARVEHNNYIKLREAVVKVQCLFRAKLLMRKQRIEFVKLRQACEFIQSTYRLKLLSRNQRKEFLKLRTAIVIIQQRYRANLYMKQQLNAYHMSKESAIKIQRYYRRHLLKKQALLNFKQLRCTILGLQRYGKGYLVRQKVKELMDPKLVEERKLFRQRNTAAIKIQSLWRGYSVKLMASRKLIEIRERCLQANINATLEDTIGSRATRAIHILSSNDTYKQMIDALIDLDYVTRHCKIHCIQCSQLLPIELYDTITTVNRSVPDVKASSLAASILVNMSKLEQCRVNVWQPQYLDKLVTVMMHMCDKETMLYCYLVTLFWILAHNDNYKQEITKIPNIKQRLHKITSMCERMERMVKRGAYKGLTSVFYTNRKCYLPGIKPDWGLDLPTSPRNFTNAVFASNELINFLQLP